MLILIAPDHSLQLHGWSSWHTIPVGTVLLASWRWVQTGSCTYISDEGMLSD